ncbi:NADPH-dependent FMN reductase [Dictyobacter aurantiacus]|uniref:FMN-dependent NADPH-azoreductase n=1 Tax=Dictyobacter aurantiacus TaxID=1936993 RepID=A0A401ZLK1_9CHLR|nr:NAD(P)H-dependent oxidoreductase [Dictyobacter aurantiacus]GCE07700.1 FMN-dependent NADPH-azoreductase [Dictyobacter aurantiacus]
MTESGPRVFLIAGSADKNSYIRTSMEILANTLRESGAQVDLWDLAEQPLPLLCPSILMATPQSVPFPVHQFTQLAEQADAFVLGSPVYHNSYSGILKNALDLLSSQHLFHKPVALISNGNSDRTACLPCEHLRSVVKGLSAIAIPTQLVTIPADFLPMDNQHVLTNTRLLERFSLLAKELLYFTTFLHHDVQTQVS